MDILLCAFLTTKTTKITKEWAGHEVESNAEIAEIAEADARQTSKPVARCRPMAGSLARAKRARATNPAIPAISALGNSASPSLRGQDFLMRIDTTSDGQ